MYQSECKLRASESSKSRKGTKDFWRLKTKPSALVEDRSFGFVLFTVPFRFQPFFYS